MKSAIEPAERHDIPGLPAFMAPAWQFLTRCQAEAFPLIWGNMEDTVIMPRETEAIVALHMEDNPKVVIRWRRRKNRPQGSTLTRYCTCKCDTETCVVHQMANWAQESSADRGRPVWPQASWDKPTWNPNAVRGAIRKLLVQGNVPNANEMTFKAFRAGRATHLAATGNPLWMIMSLGECHDPRTAPRNYINGDIADTRATVDAMLDASDNDL